MMVDWKSVSQPPPNGAVVPQAAQAFDGLRPPILEQTGGFVTGALGRILAPRTTPVYLAVAPMAVFAVVYTFMAFTVQGDLATDLVQGGFPRLLRIMPLDMAAGALAGTSLGFGFMRSFAEPKTA